MNKKECLTAARELIRTKGWCQNMYSNGHGYCIGGAIMATKADEWTKADAWTVVREQLQWSDPVIYNDYTGRTKEDVLSLLERAIGTL